MARHRKRHRRRYSNPLSPTAILSKPREMFTKEFATSATYVVVGLMIPQMALGMLPVGFRDTKLKLYASKVFVIAGLSTLAGMVSRKAAQFVLVGGGASLLMDLWAEWQARNRPTSPGTSAYYGDNMDAYYGDDNRLGDDLVISGSADGMY